MSLASWIRLPKFRLASALKPSRRSQPSRSRLLVEQLEDRMLLSAAVNNVPTLNNSAATFNTQQIGLTLPQVQPNQLGNPLAVTQIVNGMQFPILSGVAIGAQANLPAQSQLYDQFRAFGVNSQGQGNAFPTMQWLYAQTAMGFGSGTQPNAPWMPAAYNLGLANHQVGYPSQSDLGFSPTPPWFRPTTQPLSPYQALDADTDESLTPESLRIHQPKEEQHWTDDQTIDESEKTTARTQNPEENEQADSEETVPGAVRGDPAIEDALFTDPLHTLIATIRANRLSYAAAKLPNGKHAIVEEANTTDGDASEENAIPSPLWLSALAPAQMAALVVGLSGVAPPTNGAGTPVAEGAGK